MKKKFFCICVMLIGILLPTSAQTFQNPVIWADVPDMDVIRVDDTFYMVSTTMHLMPGAPIMESHDLVNWKIIDYLFDKLTDSPKYDMSGGTAYGRGQWATSLKYHHGKFYALFAPNDLPGNETYIMTSDKAAGPWRVVSRLPHFHDASLFFDDDNRIYVIYGTGDMVKLAQDLKSVKSDSHVKLFERDAEENGLLEGSRMLKKDGRYYLLMISWAKNHPRREVCYRSDNIRGPYEKKIILETRFDGFDGVAQGTIVDTKDGRWYGMIFQDRNGVGRVPTVEQCIWKDGWPMLGNADGNEIPKVMEKPVQGFNDGGIVTSDDFSGNKLKPEWEWNHNPINKAWSLTEREGWLRLKTSRVAQNIFVAPNTISQRMEGPGCEGIICIDISGMRDGDVTGLSAFQNDALMLSVVKEGKKLYLVGTTESVSLEPETHAVTGVDRKELFRMPLKRNVIYLKVEADFVNGHDVAAISYSLDGKTFKKVIKDFKLIYDYRRFFMGTRFGIYNYATKLPGGYVDIDYFHYKRYE
ncbi:MAG: glycoside hydrolase family 43 protein [Phocaeicola sp.]|uniref:glycoside hydrolase family 43 protein n=1 Tax=Phocaeicola sp. TaxID=2773926 RepID=UPI003F9FF476